MRRLSPRAGRVLLVRREGDEPPRAVPADSELEPISVTPAWRGRGVGAALARTVLEAARARGDRYLMTRPVARNDAALRFFHSLGFDALGQLELIADLRPPRTQTWRPGATLANREFRL